MLQPNMLDSMQRRGRVLKKMGAFRKAAEAVDGARVLDTADRYMNSKVCTTGFAQVITVKFEEY